MTSDRNQLANFKVHMSRKFNLIRKLTNKPIQMDKVRNSLMAKSQRNIMRING